MGIKPQIPPGSILTTKKKKIKKKFFPQNDTIRRENRSRNFFRKKNFFLGLGRFFEVDLGQKKVKNFFFIFRLQMAQFVQKTGLEKNLRLFVKKHQTLEAYISANMHPNNFWTTFLESESQNKSTLRKLAVTHV